MNESLLSTDRSILFTSTIVNRATTSRIPYREQVLIDAFNTYIQIGIGSLLFLFGLTFNCLSLLYFRASRSFRHTTFQLYFSIIAILDTIRLLEFLIFILFDKGYLRVTLPLCRWIFFTIMFTGQASIWLTVALAVEKCIIIWFPIKGRLCFTISISKIVLIIVLCLVFAANLIYLLPNFFLHAYENLSIHTFMCIWHTGGQSTRSRFDQWKKHYFTFNTIFFHSIIPSILLLVINWLILYSLSRQRVILSKIGSIDTRHVLKREKQFKEKTIQLVLSSFFVIFTISPRYILTMVNAFATSISKAPLMPLYIYVNLNTVFRVLEMSNYSLNLMFAIMSGRTSRCEIRKLLWEGLFWRFQRVKSRRQGSKMHTHSYLFDDDDEDTERSAGTATGVTSYCPLGTHVQTRSNYLTQPNSSNTYPSKSSQKSSLFNCCGFSIDLSHKHSLYSLNADIASRRSTIRKLSTNTTSNNNTNYNTSPRKSRTYSHSSKSSSFDRNLRQQQTVCYKSNFDNNRTATCRRASAAVYCFQHLPSSTVTSMANQSLGLATNLPSVRQSISNEKNYSSIEILPPINSSDATPTTIDEYNNNNNNSNINPLKDTTESSVLVQNNVEEQQLTAYVVETC
ncbi:unnamed protein product [Rotaria socialis]|uniref:G-protein coupled receptors family 1 profile domain-containing protein n=1 Tax=Rotaria socialis TaxID=392032 RepID=A0A818HFC8_9BILA|nr:unnamed protein product [Rotaria socialis]CAF3421092.1 unnamed protein product [Rotaria socialis]CAF3503552.1 unnamed protein product [Rotaria socialis]CAF4105524.1 unnamed protein product [Rotaria socialis]CAF4136410.1 unnamed protein product [Rotaria socialis]